MGKKGQHGFRVPEGYFNRFPGKLQDRLRQEDAMPENPSDHTGPSSEELSGISRKPMPDRGFQTPDGYFETFGQRLQKRLENPGDSVQSQPRVFRLSQRYMGWTAAVAAAILLAIVLWPASTNQNLNFEDLADAEIEQYLEVGYEDISAYELAESLPLDQLEINDVMDTGTQEQQLLEYLDSDPEALEEVYWEEEIE